MITFKKFITESINDKGLFKAIFVIGLPGAGKSYTISKINGTIAPKIVNTDKAGEFLSKKWNKQINSETWSDFKDTAHRITQANLTSYIDGMLPLFIDGTSNDVSNILHRIGILESLGYDVGVAFVQADLQTSINRAKLRAEKTGRHVDEDFIKHVHDQNQDNANYLKSKVSFFVAVENNDDTLDDTDMLEAFKKTQKFFNSPIDNPIGKRYLEELKKTNSKYLTPNLIDREVLGKKIAGWYKS